ncbi:transglycosylase-like protein with SLT domain [Tamaricihabitans halophyticus]|uniref:Transglycosylase-like protein with SLT domain n=1 Tax=Tamaricihabitans halophyticus TaxID=1262583 RepID=A0A4R2PRZ9_9PSEU|nr:transglycosylase SLT domain-containing protein [Tamaricihabitans halophyticus]TCP38693.1 transglycosylase-like protein with SLT domain [Tamaricihabitans halophyticus]
MARPRTSRKRLLAILLGALGLAALEPLRASVGAPAPTASPVADIPAEYVGWYRQAAGTCPDLDWALLAAIGKVETNHGRAELPGVSSGTNYAGAGGPMQFLAPTFAEVRSKHPEVGSDLYDPATAIPAAAHYLCDSGLAVGDEYGAIFTYNRADWYVAKVRAQAAAYRAAP